MQLSPGRGSLVEVCQQAGRDARRLFRIPTASGNSNDPSRAVYRGVSGLETLTLAGQTMVPKPDVVIG